MLIPTELWNPRKGKDQEMEANEKSDHYIINEAILARIEKAIMDLENTYMEIYTMFRVEDD